MLLIVNVVKMWNHSKPIGVDGDSINMITLISKFTAPILAFVARAQTIESWCQFKTMRKCLRNMIRLVLFLAAVINNDDMWSMYSAKWRKICKSRLINTIDARILLQSQLRSPIIINTLWSIYMKQYTVAVKIMWIHHTSVRMFKIDLTQSLFHSSFS